MCTGEFRRSTLNVQRPAKWARDAAASPSTNHLSLVTRETGEGVVVEHRTVVPQKTPNAEHPAAGRPLLGVRLASLADIVSQPVHPTIERLTRVLEKPER